MSYAYSQERGIQQIALMGSCNSFMPPYRHACKPDQDLPAHILHRARCCNEGVTAICNRIEFGRAIGHYAGNVWHGEHEAAAVSRINGADNMAVSLFSAAMSPAGFRLEMWGHGACPLGWKPTATRSEWRWPERVGIPAGRGRFPARLAPPHPGHLKRRHKGESRQALTESIATERPASPLLLAPVPSRTCLGQWQKPHLHRPQKTTASRECLSCWTCSRLRHRSGQLTH